MPPGRKEPKVFDEAKLNAMSAPFSVYVERKENGRTTPITMPPKPGTTLGGGLGYDFDDVRNLNQLLLEYAGGGLYRVLCTDDQNAKLEWEIYLDPNLFPSKIPPNMAQHAAPQPQQQPQQQQAAPPVMLVAPMMTAPPPAPVLPINVPSAPPVSPTGAPEWMSQVQGGVPKSFVSQQPAQQPAGWSQMSTFPTTYPPVAPSLSNDPRDRERDLERQLASEREARLLAAEKAERDKLETSYQRQLDELKRVIEAKNGQIDPAMIATLEQLKRQNEALERRLTEQSTKSEQTNLMAVVLQMQQQAAQQAQQQQAAQQAQMNQFMQLFLSNASNKGVDPTVQVILENSRQQAQMHQEMLRLQQEQARERERDRIGPRDLIDMSEKLRASSGADVLLRNMGDAYQTMMNGMRNLMELQQQMVGGGSNPVVELVGNTIKEASDGLKKWLETREALANGESRAKIAQAQAEAYAAQSAAIQAQVAAGVTPQGAQPAAPGTPAQQRPVQTQGAPTQVQPGPAPASPEEQRAAVEQYEIRLFGPAIELVERLRKDVMVGQVTPDQVFEWLKQALPQLKAYVTEKKITLQALYFFEQGMYDELVRALVPDASRDFQVALVQRLAGGSSTEASKQPMKVALPANGAGKPEEDEEEEEEEEKDA